jgi:hypothetical protein
MDHLADVAGNWRAILKWILSDLGEFQVHSPRSGYTVPVAYCFLSVTNRGAGGGDPQRAMNLQSEQQNNFTYKTECYMSN